jgi:hypothetical protein
MDFSQLSDAELEGHMDTLQHELDCLRKEQIKRGGVDMQPLIEECRRLISQGNKTAAVTLYRRKKGCGLREAYDAVTNLY